MANVSLTGYELYALKFMADKHVIISHIHQQYTKLCEIMLLKEFAACSDISEERSVKPGHG